MPQRIRSEPGFGGRSCTGAVRGLWVGGHKWGHTPPHSCFEASEVAPAARVFGGPLLTADRGATPSPQVHPGGWCVCTRGGRELIFGAPQAVSWPCGSLLQEIPADVYFKPPSLCSVLISFAPSSKWELFSLGVNGAASLQLSWLGANKEAPCARLFYRI